MELSVNHTAHYTVSQATLLRVRPLVVIAVAAAALFKKLSAQLFDMVSVPARGDSLDNLLWHHDIQYGTFDVAILLAKAFSSWSASPALLLNSWMRSNGRVVVRTSVSLVSSILLLHTSANASVHERQYGSFWVSSLPGHIGYSRTVSENRCDWRCFRAVPVEVWLVNFFVLVLRPVSRAQNDHTYKRKDVKQLRLCPCFRLRPSPFSRRRKASCAYA